MIHYNNLANNVLKDKSLLYDFRRKIMENPYGDIERNIYTNINPLVDLIAPVIVKHYLKYFFPISCRQSIKIIKYYISLFHHVSKHPATKINTG